MKIETPFNFRDQVECTMTGLTGTVVAVDVWKNGCVRLCVQPRLVKDGKAADVTWVDEQDLTILQGTEKTSEQAPPSGGPQADCPAPGRK